MRGREGVIDASAELRLPSYGYPTKFLNQRQHPTAEADVSQDAILGDEGPPVPTHDEPFGRDGEYVLKKPLGEGSSGRVYLAEKRSNSGGPPTRCAIKVVAPSHGMDVNARLRFMREIETLARSGNHPNLITFRHTDTDPQSGHIFLEMDLVSGVTLSQLVERALHENTPINHLHAVAITLQIAAGLNFLHTRRIVHGDIKLLNVVLDRETGLARLIDFSEATRVGDAIMGMTKGFAAPEMYRDGACTDVRMDVYALAAVLWCLLSLEHAKQLDNRADLNWPPPYRAEVSAELDQVLWSALAPDPVARTPTIQQFINDLEGACPDALDVAPKDLVPYLASFMWRELPTDVPEPPAVPRPIATPAARPVSAVHSPPVPGEAPPTRSAAPSTFSGVTLTDPSPGPASAIVLGGPRPDSAPPAEEDRVAPPDLPGTVRAKEAEWVIDGDWKETARHRFLTVHRADEPSVRGLLKSSLNPLTLDSRTLARFNRTREILSRDPPVSSRVARLLDFAPRHQQFGPFMIFEFADGPSMSEWLGNPDRDTVGVIGQVLEALTVLHAGGVYHRDLKPSNVLVTADGVKIIDFEAARTTGHRRITATHEIFGTEHYFPPEIILGTVQELSEGDLDLQRDLWAVAQIFFESLSGEPLYQHDSSRASLVRSAASYERRVEDLARAHPVHAALLRKGLARDPARRFGSAKEFHEHLRRHSEAVEPVPPDAIFFAGSGESPDDALPVVAARRSRPWWVLVGVVLLVVLVILLLRSGCGRSAPSLVLPGQDAGMRLLRLSADVTPPVDAATDVQWVLPPAEDGGSIAVQTVLPPPSLPRPVPFPSTRARRVSRRLASRPPRASPPTVEYEPPHGGGARYRVVDQRDRDLADAMPAASAAGAPGRQATAAGWTNGLAESVRVLQRGGSPSFRASALTRTVSRYLCSRAGWAHTGERAQQSRMATLRRQVQALVNAVRPHVPIHCSCGPVEERWCE